MDELHSIKAWVKTDLQIFPGTETWPHELHRTSNVVKRTLSDLLSTRTGFHISTSFSAPTQWWKTALQIFLGNETCMHKLHRTFNVVKRTSLYFLGTKPSLHHFTTPSHGQKRLYRSILPLKLAGANFKQPLRWLKQLYKTFPALKQACMIFTVPTHGWKPIYRYFLALKHGCTSFIALPMHQQIQHGENGSSLH